MMTIAPHLREYWIVKRVVGGKPQWLNEFGTWTADRADADPYYDSETAHEDAKEYGATVVHVTVTTAPKGQRAAWERVVKAAVAMCDAFEAGKRSLDPGVTVARGAELTFRVAADSLGSHRPESK